MSSPQTNRSSIFGWVPKIAINQSTDSLSDSTHNQQFGFLSKSPQKSSNYNESLSSSISRIRSNSNSIYLPNGGETGEYFGIPLDEALNKSSAKISILGVDSLNGNQYGSIPIVVAKCGVYLKNNGLTVEGIFRVNGSAKRIKELQIIFDTPPSFGKKLNWDGYTVHDAASILRRYLNSLPEPLINFELYASFRNVLSPRIVSYLKFKSQNELIKSPPIVNEEKPKEIETEFEDRSKKKSRNYKKLSNDVHAAIEKYQDLINQLPISSKQLLFYILDLLAMVQNHAKENLMSARNLAAIFQPAILSHPEHNLDPEEYALSQLVVEFLIRYAYKLLPKEEEQEVVTSTSTTPLDEPMKQLGIISNENIPVPFDSDLDFSDGSDLEVAHMS